MYTAQSPLDLGDYRQYLIWLVSIVLVAFGFRYVKEIVSLVLEKLYEVFIQQNTSV